MPSLCIVVDIADIHVAVNYIKPLSVAMNTQEWDPLQLSSYKIFRTVGGSN